MGALSNDFLHDAGLSDVSERTEDTRESSPNNVHRVNVIQIKSFLFILNKFVSYVNNIFSSRNPTQMWYQLWFTLGERNRLVQIREQLQHQNE